MQNGGFVNKIQGVRLSVAKIHRHVFENPGYKEEFTILNSIRNKLTHLGISSQDEYFVLAGRIANILNYVHFNILYELDYNLDSRS